MTPGHIDVVKAGCTCPSQDFGVGRITTGAIHAVAIDREGFVIRTDCPLHGSPKEGQAHGDQN